MRIVLQIKPSNSLNRPSQVIKKNKDIVNIRTVIPMEVDHIDLVDLIVLILPIRDLKTTRVDVVQAR